jgi:hypothetical protein
MVNRPTDPKIRNKQKTPRSQQTLEMAPVVKQISRELPQNVQIHTSKFLLITGVNLKLLSSNTKTQSTLPGISGNVRENCQAQHRFDLCHLQRALRGGGGRPKDFCEALLTTFVYLLSFTMLSLFRLHGVEW